MEDHLGIWTTGNQTEWGRSYSMLQSSDLTQPGLSLPTNSRDWGRGAGGFSDKAPARNFQDLGFSAQHHSRVYTPAQSQGCGSLPGQCEKEGWNRGSRELGMFCSGAGLITQQCSAREHSLKAEDLIESLAAMQEAVTSVSSTTENRL